MLRGFLTWGLALAVLAAFAAGCNLFSPQSSKSTVEVSSTVSGNTSNDCSISADLNGGATITVGNGTYYTFPSVSPGGQTVYLIMNTNSSTSCGTGLGNCTFQASGNQNYNVSFNTTAGNVYVVQVTDISGSPSSGQSCRAVSVIAP